MSQTAAGGIKAKATIHRKYGKDYFREIGKLGGAAGHYGGFNAMTPEQRSAAGKKGALSANRKGLKIPPHIVMQKGKVRWYYNVVAHNGKILGTSQHYWSKSNCVRAAKATATALGGTIIIREK